MESYSMYSFCLAHFSQHSYCEAHSAPYVSIILSIVSSNSVHRYTVISLFILLVDIGVAYRLMITNTSTNNIYMFPF